MDLSYVIFPGDCVEVNSIYGLFEVSLLCLTACILLTFPPFFMLGTFYGRCLILPNLLIKYSLISGTFHESAKESADARWRPGMQGRGGKGGWGNSSRQLSNSSDITGRNAPAEKEIGVNPNMDKCNSSVPVNPNTDTKTSTSISSLSVGQSNGSSEPVASMEKSSLAIGQLQISDSKGISDLEGTSRSSGLSSTVVPSGSRPSSSCSSRAQQLSSVQKVVPNKEWKPKSTNKPAHAENVICDKVPVSVETVPQSILVSDSIHKEDTTSGVETRPSDMRLSDKQHVIIPDHLQVAESEKYGLSFGSFGACFEQSASFSKDTESEKCSTPQCESSQEADEVLDEPAASHQGVSSTVEMAAESDLQQLPAETADNILPQKVDSSSSIPEVAESDQSNDTIASHVPQDSVETTTPYPPQQSHGDQIPSLETSESQARLVQQVNDSSAGYYTQFYRPPADFDGRISPFTASGAAIKYGNLSVMPTQTGHAQEGINSFVLPSVGSTPLATPTPGAVPNSVGIPQQPLQLFRQHLGVLPQYPPNYFPYSQYPLYVPPQPLHFMVPQPPSTGGMYPPVSAAVAPPGKYPTNTYKPGANNGTQTHVGNHGAYGTYDSSPSIYTNNTMVASGTSVESDDISGSQFKETNVYIAGQQSEGSGVWIPAPGRDISGLQPSNYYGLPLQGQHLAFAPAQAGHGTFGGIYHPAQTMAGAAVHPLLQPPQAIAGVGGEMVGPPANGYQQPQRAQMNWPNY
ncbi:hypothetical protein OsI_30606 [Oryza sativa Indica Group]|uniref:GBF-interacting protein 1 N-terminal domain-containing protein n=1 Tax=Oryza sativa subsp. indica TaxID=39946 RepID=B8BDH5_ORYSI|nr:hypothetical protein OsI_30606 [Oryza sativa Indica Group]